MISHCERSKSKKKEAHRFPAWVLCFCIMLTGYSDLSGRSFVFAQEQESVSGNDMPAADIALPVLPTEEESVSDNSIQPKAALRSQAEARWQGSENGEWKSGSLQEAVEAIEKDSSVQRATIELQSNVELTSGITISQSKRITITSPDPKHPYMIKNTAQDTDDYTGKREEYERGRIFTIKEGQVFLQDIILDGGRNEGVTAFHPLICLAGENSVLVMLDGTVLQNAENKSQHLFGGGIGIWKGRVYMQGDENDSENHGAKITACKATHGGGVGVNGTKASFAMTRGSIENCEAVDGGGVYVNIGQFQMGGGQITGNRATGGADGDTHGGGGVCVVGHYPTGSAAFLIADGTISGNEAPLSNGGGILVDGNYNLLWIVGGTLEGNTARNGGGISMMMGEMKLYGGTVTTNNAGLYGGGILGSPLSTIELQGSPKVFGNTAGDTQDRFDNLYLDGDVNDSSKETTVPVRLTGPLTDGVQLGLSLWVRPDEDVHPYRDMIVPYKGYTISQSDLDRLCDDRADEHKELYVDNMEKYALIPYDGKIVMVPAVHVSLDRDSLVLESEGETASLTATVTPAHAPVKDVTWTSSDETVATVDENGKVTATGKGEAVITATTVSPYHDAKSCHVKVGIFRYQLTTSAAHGRITYTPASPDGTVEEADQVALRLEPDPGYRLKEGSLSACWTDDQSVTVVIEGNTLTMPEHNATVSAEFEPIPYQIVYHLDGGALKAGESNPDSYTIESGDITLNNPVRSGYRFIGWTGTGLTKTEAVVRIPSGSMGAREYTAVWEKEDSGKPDNPDTPQNPDKPDNPDTPQNPDKPDNPNPPQTPDEPDDSNSPQKPDTSAAAGDTGDNQYVDNGNIEEAAAGQTELPENNEQSAVKSGGAQHQTTQNLKAAKNPRTGSYILWLYTAAALSALCMLVLTFLRVKKRPKKQIKKRQGKKKGTRTRSHAASTKSKPKRRKNGKK